MQVNFDVYSFISPWQECALAMVTDSPMPKVDVKPCTLCSVDFPSPPNGVIKTRLHPDHRVLHWHQLGCDLDIADDFRFAAQCIRRN